MSSAVPEACSEFLITFEFPLEKLIKLLISLLEMKLSVEMFYYKLDCITHATSIYINWVSTNIVCVTRIWEGMPKREMLSVSDEMIRSAPDAVAKGTGKWIEQAEGLSKVV